MARTAEETASILIGLYDESFAGDSFKPFRISWPELRSLAGVAKLADEYLWEIDLELKESGYFLFPLDNFVLMAQESDLSYVRAVPPRIVEQYLPDDDDDLDLLGLDDEDDLEGSEVLETLFGENSPLGTAAHPNAKAGTGVKSGGHQRSKGSEKPEEISE
jgi:hypothetical protein